MNNDLLQKLMISKQIMDRHNEMPRNQQGGGLPALEEFEAPKAQYNLPQEFITENKVPTNPSVPTKDRILNSKLPDEIKKLMIEHPISQPQNSGTVLSDELVEAASRLMKKENKQSSSPTQKQVSSNVDINTIRSVVRETMEQVLKEHGLLNETVSESNEMIRFQVGEHIFEGKVTKIKKIKKS